VTPALAEGCLVCWYWATAGWAALRPSATLLRTKPPG